MKELFPIFAQKKEGKDLIYLDSAASSHKPYCVIDAISKFYSKEYSTVHRSLYSSGVDATYALENVRSLVAKLIKAEAEEVIFTHSATESINLVAYAYGEKNIEGGDEVLVSIKEHHSNYIPWKMLCERKGAKFITFGIHEDGTIDMDDYKSKISSKTKIVAICQVSNVLGIENPIKEMVEIAHKYSAVVLVDGCQMIAHEKVDVKNLDADFYVFSSHKMYGPTGVGILYGKKELLNAMDPFHGGGGMVESVGEEFIFRAPPHKFEAGTPMIASIIGLGEAINFIHQIGFDTISKRGKQLSIDFFDALDSHVTFITKLCRGSPILTFIPKGIHPLDFSMLLSLENICVRAGNMCAQPLFKHLNLDGAIRISLGIYNNEQDLQVLLKGLDTLKQMV
jgi:cysteine desulfurase/selenocysteine lyase